MKNSLLIFAAIAILFSFAFQSAAVKSDATVDQKEGVYIFMLAKPKAEYDYLGTIKKSVSLTGQPTEMLNSMIKKAKKEHPTCDAIIFTSLDMDKADAVKLK